MSESQYEVRLTSADQQVILRFWHDSNYVADTNTRAFAEIGCEPEVTHLMMRVLRPGDIAIDVGANIGFFTILMGVLVGPTGKVFAIEPHPENARRLRRNVELNGLTNVEVIEKAAWHAPAEQTLYTTHDSGEHSLRSFVTVTGSRTVETIRLDSLGVHPRLIKVDVEGAEVNAMKGASQILFRDMPLVVSELSDITLDRFGNTPKTLRDQMGNWGYDTFVLRPDGNLPPMLPPDTRLTWTRNNQMVLFATVEQAGKIWPEYDMRQHDGSGHPVLPAASDPEGAHQEAPAGADA